MPKSRNFQLRLALLSILIIGLFAVPVTMVINKKKSSPKLIQPTTHADKHSATDSIRSDSARVANQPGYADSNTSEKSAAQYKSQNLTSSTGIQRQFVAGDWVVVDCSQRIILQCPHHLLAQGQTPSFVSAINTPVYRGRCRDVSIQIESYCRY